MAEITHFSQLDLNGIYSYADYLTWKFEQVLELVKGKILPMAAPSRAHQRVSWQLGGLFFNYFKHHRCEAYAAPFDVRLFNWTKSLNANKDIYSVVQPDLCVVCDLDKLDESGCLGAPDLMVEILSPGNSKREMKIKKDLYAESGVREYWIVNYTHETITRFNLEADGTYGRPLIFVDDEAATSLVFPDFVLNLNELFLPTDEKSV